MIAAVQKEKIKEEKVSEKFSMIAGGFIVFRVVIIPTFFCEFLLTL